MAEDWAKDIARHNSGNDVLNHRQFSDALFELVDEWYDFPIKTTDFPIKTTDFPIKTPDFRVSTPNFPPI